MRVLCIFQVRKQHALEGVTRLPCAPVRGRVTGSGNGYPKQVAKRPAQVNLFGLAGNVDNGPGGIASAP